MIKSEDRFYCPHCNHLYEDIQDYGFDNDEMIGNFKMQCESCVMEFEVGFRTVIHFETKGGEWVMNKTKIVLSLRSKEFGEETVEYDDIESGLRIYKDFASRKDYSKVELKIIHETVLMGSYK